MTNEQSQNGGLSNRRNHIPKREGVTLNACMCIQGGEKVKGLVIKCVRTKWKVCIGNTSFFVKNGGSVPISRFFEERWKFFDFLKNRSKMFFKIGVLENFAIFTGKQLCWSLLKRKRTD